MACKRRHLLGFPHERRLWKSHTCCGSHKEPSNAPLQHGYTSPQRVRVCACVCQCVIRKWGAVGVRAVSCWWEWDKNLFPLPKPLALSEASVFFYEATHTQKRTHTHTLTKVCSENRKKVGARKANSTGHRHFGPQTHTDTHTHTYARLYTATFLSYL